MNTKGKILVGAIITMLVGISVVGSIRLYNILFPDPWYVEIINKILG